jgi:hypothetical protein
MAGGGIVLGVVATARSLGVEGGLCLRRGANFVEETLDQGEVVKYIFNSVEAVSID